jgi:hypothetical protein
MPYVVCPRCALQTYTAARHSTQDSCPRCDHRLARTPGIVARAWLAERASREIVPKRLPASVRVAP